MTMTCTHPITEYFSTKLGFHIKRPICFWYKICVHLSTKIVPIVAYAQDVQLSSYSSSSMTIISNQLKHRYQLPRLGTGYWIYKSLAQMSTVADRDMEIYISQKLNSSTRVCPIKFHPKDIHIYVVQASKNHLFFTLHLNQKRQGFRELLHTK